jgi:hypothetical protein
MATPHGEPDFYRAAELGRGLAEYVLREQGVLIGEDSVLDLVQLQNVGCQAADEGLVATVRQARRYGRSWTEIGSRFGLTKQAAQQRFGPKLGDGLGAGDGEDGPDLYVFHLNQPYPGSVEIQRRETGEVVGAALVLEGATLQRGYPHPDGLLVLAGTTAYKVTPNGKIFEGKPIFSATRASKSDLRLAGVDWDADLQARVTR